jgi:hypothetical protein
LTWECVVDDGQSVSARCTTPHAEMAPSAILAEAIHAGRSAIDRAMDC